MAWWTGIMFLTNVFFIPFLALRAAPEPEQTKAAKADAATPRPLPSWAPTFGGVGLAVGLFSVFWFLGGRPEYGDLASR